MPVIAALLGLAVCGTSLGPAQTVKLEYKSFQGCDGRFAYRVFYGGLLPEGASGGGPAVPDGAVGARYIELIRNNAGGSANPHMIWGVLAKSSPKAEFADRIWIDWNSSGKFGPDDCADLQCREGGSAIYAPKMQPKIDGIREPLRLRVGDDGIRVEPAGYRVGVATVGGRAVKIGVVDADLTGVFPAPDSGERAASFLLIDYDGDGTLAKGGGEAGYLEYPGASAPLGQPVLLPDKAFYQVAVSPTGRKLTLRKIRQPLGAVSVNGGRIRELTLSCETGLFVTRQMGKTCPVPVGTYSVGQLSVMRGGWAYQIHLPKALVVRAGKTARLPSGLPFNVKLNVSRRAGTFEFSAGPSAAARAGFGGVYEPNGEQVPAPTLSIRDSKGRVVQGLAFEYG
jgi:hypothetical protein